MAISKTAKPATTPLESAIAQFEAAAESLNLDPGLRQVLCACKRELAAAFPVQMDDGSTQVFRGFRVQHNVARGPAKGGIRYQASGHSARPSGHTSASRPSNNEPIPPQSSALAIFARACPMPFAR